MHSIYTTQDKTMIKKEESNSANENTIEVSSAWRYLHSPKSIQAWVLTTPWNQKDYTYILLIIMLCQTEIHHHTTKDKTKVKVWDGAEVMMYINTLFVTFDKPEHQSHDLL